MDFYKTNFIKLLIVAMVFAVATSGGSYAAITGNCSDCHTMHNSQDGSPMATINGESGPNPFLTKGSCLGCHAQWEASNIVILGSNDVPQVYHQDANDLAGGNFSYMMIDDANGHNVVDFGSAYLEATLVDPPGHYHAAAPGHVDKTNLTCAGINGCHGYRATGNEGIGSMRGAHHNNVDGLLTTADSVDNSYRFLFGVKGLENPIDKWRNVSAASHNEYLGATEPLSQTADPCFPCHNAPFINVNGDPDFVRPQNGTISGFCGTCHGTFHLLGGIGGDFSSPFIRHPSDVVLKDSGEYAAYTTYDETVPVGKQNLLGTPDSQVQPGSDTVTCLSCHQAHASPYPDMLRWDYTEMITGTTGPGQGKGCFVCHTQKDG